MKTLLKGIAGLCIAGTITAVAVHFLRKKTKR